MEAADTFRGTNRFELRQRIGEGGMGVVYSAWDHERDALVALKTLNRVDAASIYRLKHEFRSLAEVRHPNLILLHELFCIDGQWFFTMELVDGVRFTKFVRDGNRVRIPELRLALSQLVQGVRAIHDAGLLHRDIKPSNVLVSTEGLVKILDFGLVRPHRVDGRTMRSYDEGTVGTPLYMSPEQFTSDGLTPASDWYSVGVMLYEALVGKQPFLGTLGEIVTQKLSESGPNPAEEAPDTPEDLAVLTASLLERLPYKRPSEELLVAQTSLGTAPRAPTVPARDQVPFVGRADELGRLRDALQHTRQGKPVFVRVSGGSGIGKTALVSQFIDEIEVHKRAVVLTGRCYERETLPFKAVDAVIDSLTQYLRRLPHAEAVSLLPRHVQALARLFPVLRRVDAIADAPETTRAPDAREVRRRAFAALRELLNRVCDRTPLVVWVDDAQWGDADSATLLLDVLLDADAPPLLLVLSHRPTTSPLLTTIADRLATDEEIIIGPLPPDDSEQLAAEWAQTTNAAMATQMAAVVRESEGNPFFVGELVRYLQSQQMAPESSRESGITDVTLGSVLEARIDALEESSRRVLALVGVAGRPIQRRVVLAAVAGSEPETITSLAAMHLLKSGGPKPIDPVETYHDRIRERVVAGLDAEELKANHRALADALEASGLGDAETLASHYLAAGETDLAARYALRAADEAMQALAAQRAAQLYTMALEHASFDAARRRQVRVRLADALADAGRCKEAADNYLDVARERSDEGLELKQKAMFQLLIGGHLREGLAVSNEVLDQLGLYIPSSPLRATTSTLYWRARLRMRGFGFRWRDPDDVGPSVLHLIDACHAIAMGLGYIDPWRSRGLAARGLHKALEVGEPSRILKLLVGEAALHAGRGDAERAAEITELSRAIAQRLDTPHAHALVTATDGTCKLFAGRWKEAADLCQRAARMFREECTNVAWETTTADWFSVWVLFYCGELARLRMWVPELLEEAQRLGNLYQSTTLRSSYGCFAWLVADEPDVLRSELQTVAKEWKTERFLTQDYWLMQSAALLDIYDGNPVAAQDRIERDWDAFRRTLLLLAPVVRLQAWSVRALVAVASARVKPDRRDFAMKWTKKNANRLMQLSFPGAVATALVIEAARAHLAGAQDSAARLLGKAAESYAAHGMPIHKAASMRHRAAILGLDVEADELTEQGAARPERLAHAILPGFDV